MSAARNIALGCALLMLACGAEIALGRGGKPQPSPPPNPDIVYMSSSSRAPDNPAIRGVSVTITGNTINSTDTQLLKGLASRDRGSIAWSPDGLRYAWIEEPYTPTAKIMWAAPGKTPSVLYAPYGASDPYVLSDSDVLAWSDACSGNGSVLVFARDAKWDTSVDPAVQTELPAIMAIDIEAASGSESPPSFSSPREIKVGPYPTGFAFSPTGQYLVFSSGHGENEKVSMESMCSSPQTSTTLLTWNDLSAAKYPYACSDNAGSNCLCNGDPAKVCYTYPSHAVQSIDWSGDGKRLALSVITGPDANYPWRDLRVAYLDGNEIDPIFTKNRVVRIDFDAIFGPASSEHSPQWGPGISSSDCERLAFSQSAGASDGSTMNGRRLFLHDLVTTNSTCLSGPREISARDPRAIDWK